MIKLFANKSFWLIISHHKFYRYDSESGRWMMVPINEIDPIDPKSGCRSPSRSHIIDFNFLNDFQLLVSHGRSRSFYLFNFDLAAQTCTPSPVTTTDDLFRNHDVEDSVDLRITAGWDEPYVLISIDNHSTVLTNLDGDRVGGRPTEIHLCELLSSPTPQLKILQSFDDSCIASMVAVCNSLIYSVKDRSLDEQRKSNQIRAVMELNKMTSDLMLQFPLFATIGALCNSLIYAIKQNGPFDAQIDPPICAVVELNMATLGLNMLRLPFLSSRLTILPEQQLGVLGEESKEESTTMAVCNLQSVADYRAYHANKTQAISDAIGIHIPPLIQIITDYLPKHNLRLFRTLPLSEATATTTDRVASVAYSGR